MKKKVALVVGGATGIGLAVAKLLQENGYDVVISSRTKQRLEEVAAEHEFRAMTADFTNEAQVEHLFVQLQRNGGIDAIVNCAGVFDRKPLSELSDTAYQAVLDASERPARYVAMQASRVATQGRPITVILVSSFAGVSGLQLPYTAPYAAGKAAAEATTAVLDSELREAKRGWAGILSLGLVDTDMGRQAMESGHISGEALSPEKVAEAVYKMITGEYVASHQLLDAKGGIRPLNPPRV